MSPKPSSVRHVNEIETIEPAGSRREPLVSGHCCLRDGHSAIRTHEGKCRGATAKQRTFAIEPDLKTAPVARLPKLVK